jgi:hypothetical protein
MVAVMGVWLATVLVGAVVAKGVGELSAAPWQLAITTAMITTVRIMITNGMTF